MRALLTKAVLLLVANGFWAAAAQAQDHTAKIDDSPTSMALSKIPRKPGDKPVVAIYEVRSAVSGIEPKAAQEMFMTALVKSGAFSVAERARLNEGVMRERQLTAGPAPTAAANGPTTGAGAAAGGTQVVGARFVFEVVISEFNAGADTRNSNVSLGGATLTSAKNSDQLGMDIRITDVTTGLVVDSVNVTEVIASSQSQASGLGSLTSTLFTYAHKSEPVPVDAGVNNAHHDGVDRALRSCIESGVAELARRFNAR